MTDDVKTDAAPEIADPLERAKANGYVEPPESSKQDRAKALVHHVEHAMKHNSPISLHMLHELKALLGGEDEGKTEAVGDAA
jgi:hypothetical protein